MFADDVRVNVRRSEIPCAARTKGSEVTTSTQRFERKLQFLKTEWRRLYSIVRL